MTSGPYPPEWQRAYGLPPRRKPTLIGDVYNGAVRGDFARELRLPGIVTQVALGYCPGVGTLCASRDLVADLRQRDRLGAALNLLALVPLLGGFPKTAAVLRHVHLISRAIKKTRSDAQPQDTQNPYLPYSAPTARRG